MDIIHQKATQFIHRLLANPSLQDLNPMQREDQIIQFLRINNKQLYPTLCSANFFPGRNWAEIQSLLIQSLREIIDQSLFIQLKNLVDAMDFAFISFLREDGLALDEVSETIYNFQKQILKKNEARITFIGPFWAIQIGLPDRYIEEVFHRREYIYFELIKVQKLKMSKEEIKNLIKVSLLLKNSIHIIAATVPTQGTVSGIVQRQFADKVIQVLKEQLKVLPEPLILSGVNSNISFLENPKMETTSRLASIFSIRCQNYKPITKMDRGADSPDKSWFSIARRNYKFYGFDIKMLDELYKIAGENGW